MIGLELACVAIVAIYVSIRLWVEPARMRLAGRFLLLMSASWLAENTVIHAYHFYQYSPAWSLFVDRVPLLIVLIWPVVIISAWDLLRGLAGHGGPRVALAAAALVFVDAYVMEPIAVQSGLWSWNAPGLFRVPPIGVLGWSFFTASVLLVLDWADRRRATRRSASGWVDLLALPASLVAVHGLLLASWWSALRWVSGTIPAWIGVALAWALCLAGSGVALRSPAAARLARRDLLLRIPAAGFFFVLLGLHGLHNRPLVAYTVAFALPYWVLTFRARG